MLPVSVFRVSGVVCFRVPWFRCFLFPCFAFQVKKPSFAVPKCEPEGILCRDEQRARFLAEML